MLFSELMQNIAYRLAPDSAFPAPFTVTGVCRDADNASAGTVFVCADSDLYPARLAAPRAYARGCRVFIAAHEVPLPADAAVLLVEDIETLAAELAVRFYGETARNLTVIGVCGGLGKTSVILSFLDMARRAGRSAAAICREGVLKGGTLTRGKRRAPDAFDLQAFLTALAEDKTEIAVVEISTYMLLQKSAFSIPFAAVLCTNTDFAREVDGVAASAAECTLTLFSFLKEAARRGAYLFLPVETRTRDTFSDTFTPASVFYVGEEGDFSVTERREMSDRGAGAGVFTLTTPGTVFENLVLPSLSPHAAENALFAAALAFFADFDDKAVRRSLETAAPVGTMEVLSFAADRLIVADAAYTPRMLEGALRHLRGRTPGKLSVLFGSVGTRARARRAALAHVAEEHADFTYLTADDPGYEPVDAILSEMERAFEDPTRCVSIHDRAAAIARAVSELRPGDTLLLAGKARETWQEINGAFVQFSERDAVRAALDNFYALL